MNAYEDTNRKKKNDSWGVFRVVEIFLIPEKTSFFL